LRGWPTTWKWLRQAWCATIPAACLLCDAPAGNVPNLCSACAAALVRLPPRQRFAAFPYTPPISTLIQWMKFEANIPAAQALGALLAEAVIEAGMVIPDALLPVPLHASRLRSRGFNQSLELARPLAQRVGRPLLACACVRVRATRPQSSLQTARERRQNVADAFRVRQHLDRLDTVAIIDDVVTTGATARELVRVLRSAGVRQVLVWACAGPAVKRRDSPPTGHCSR
jgi:ComF family protein